MPAKKLYNDYYESGSTAKKVAPQKQVNNRKTGKNKIRTKARKKQNASMVTFILCGFAMAMLITYRFNVISEKNLKVQTLKKELTGVESSLLTSQIEVEQNTDLNKIEAYAKQKLGMQKPDKNQTIYVDTSKTGSTVEITEQANFFEGILESIKDLINDIF